MNQHEASGVGGAGETAILHPLEPLSREEIALATSMVRADMGAGEGELRFEMVELKEPPKAEVRAFAPGDPIRRAARVQVYRLGRIGVWRYDLSLTDRAILERTEHPTARPMIQLEEFLEIEAIVKSDPGFIEACRKRGIEDMEMVCVDPWSGGNFGHPDEEGRHISHAFCWVRNREHDNLYAHPIEGLNPVVDIKEQRVIRIDDRGITPIPKAESNYDRLFQERSRTDLKPIDVVQPEGVSFTMEGRRITWHDWSLVIGFNAREAITLHDIAYAGRPICYRAALAEMVVPYGSPKPQHARKNVFDIGEYGLGKLANSLELGCDCLGAIHYLDCWISDVTGEPFCIKNGICIHEEDYGILWKHWDFRTERTENRRARRLVISSISTVGNYEYGSYWYFYLDGTIEFEMKATGIINTVGCEPGHPGKYGTEVSPGVVGQIHQHIFCARLDMSVDGDRNTVVECDTVAEPEGPNNPYGNAFYVHEKPLTAECGRPRNADAERYWKFCSTERRNHVGKPTAYKLEPVHGIAPFNSPTGPSGKRMPFIYNHLWVTKAHPEERFPAGQFMNHSDGSEGVHAWAARAQPIEGEDIVAWHVFGLHHPVRLEDYPVQPVVTTGFKLMPNGFFDRNPCLDLPVETNKASCNALAAE